MLMPERTGDAAAVYAILPTPPTLLPPGVRLRAALLPLHVCAATLAFRWRLMLVMPLLHTEFRRVSSLLAMLPPPPLLLMLSAGYAACSRRRLIYAAAFFMLPILSP